MNKTTSFGLLIIAVLLLILGMEAYQSSASILSRSMTGAPTDNAVWLVISGLLAGITSIFGFSNAEGKQQDKNRQS